MTVSAREAAGEERRARIVAAALDMFAERGYKGASLTQIAERVGITQQAVLYHFRSKDQLLVAALEERDREDRQWWARTIESAAEDLDFLQLCQRLIEHNVQRLERVRLYTVLAGDSVIDAHPAQATGRPGRTATAVAAGSGGIRHGQGIPDLRMQSARHECRGMKEQAQ